MQLITLLALKHALLLQGKASAPSSSFCAESPEHWLSTRGIFGCDEDSVAAASPCSHSHLLLPICAASGPEAGVRNHPFPAVRDAQKEAV